MELHGDSELRASQPAESHESGSPTSDDVKSTQRELSPEDEECAIGDSDEDDEEMVQVQRTITQNRLQQQNSPQQLRRKVIPFHWAPMLAPLTSCDVEACDALERAAMADHGFNGVSREKIEYCIRRCGGICSGLFNTYKPDDAKGWWIQTMPHSREVETGRADGARRVMFAHIIATLGVGTVVTDNDIRFPQNWRDASASRDSTVGHQTSGRTICLHSFAVCPEVQGIDIGKNAIKAYLQLMNESGMADRVALICRESLTNFFARVGFKNAGPSTATAAGPGWHNMVYDLPGPKTPMRLERNQPAAAE